MSPEPVVVLAVDDGVGLWGAQQVLAELADPLREAGVALTLAAPPDGALAGRWRSRGLAFVPLHLPRTPALRSESRSLRPCAVLTLLLSVPQAVAGLVRAIGESHADVVLANLHPGHLLVVLAARLRRRRCVLYLHEQLPYLAGRVLRNIAIALASGAVCVSTAIYDDIPPVLRRRARVVINGVDIERYRPRPANPALRSELGVGADELLIVDITRLDPTKTVEDAIDAAATLGDAPFHLAIVGETTSHPDYAAFVKARAVAQLGMRVSFVGRRGDVAELLAQADLLLHSGRVEGTPLVVLEAQACGTPVVAYAVAGTPSVVSSGHSGLLAPVGDYAALGRSLQTYSDDPALRRQHGAHAREQAVARHQLGQQAAQLGEILTGHAVDAR